MTRRFALLAATAALLLSVPPAQAGAATRCKSSDLRYPFQPGGPNDFGVFKLRTTGGACRTARRAAQAWMRKFEANIDAGRLELPRRAAGFRFKSLQPKEAQTYRLRGRRGATTVRFDYRVPNG